MDLVSFFRLYHKSSLQSASAHMYVCMQFKCLLFLKLLPLSSFMTLSDTFSCSTVEFVFIYANVKSFESVCVWRESVRGRLRIG